MLQIYAESPSPKQLTTNSSPLKDRRTDAPKRKPQKSSIFRLGAKWLLEFLRWSWGVTRPLKRTNNKKVEPWSGWWSRGNRNTAQHRAPPDLGQICRWTRHPNGMRSLDLESQGWFQAWFVSIRLKISVVVEQKLEHVNHNLCKTWSILDLTETTTKGLKMRKNLFDSQNGDFSSPMFVYWRLLK